MSWFRADRRKLVVGDGTGGENNLALIALMVGFVSFACGNDSVNRLKAVEKLSNSAAFDACWMVFAGSIVVLVVSGVGVPGFCLV